MGAKIPAGGTSGVLGEVQRDRDVIVGVEASVIGEALGADPAVGRRALARERRASLVELGAVVVASRRVDGAEARPAEVRLALTIDARTDPQRTDTGEAKLAAVPRILLMGIDAATKIGWGIGLGVGAVVGDGAGPQPTKAADSASMDRRLVIVPNMPSPSLMTASSGSPVSP